MLTTMEDYYCRTMKMQEKLVGKLVDVDPQTLPPDRQGFAEYVIGEVDEDIWRSFR